MNPSLSLSRAVGLCLLRSLTVTPQLARSTAATLHSGSFRVSHATRCVKNQSLRLYVSAAPQTPVPAIDAADAKQKIEKREFDIVMDVREEDEYVSGHIPNAVHIPLGAVLRDMKTDKVQKYKGKKLLVYCKSGGRSGMACKALQDNGFNATNLAGGITAYRGY